MASVSGQTKQLRRRTGAAGAPAGLLAGQFFHNEVDKTLYIGAGDDGAGNSTSQTPVGGLGATMPNVRGFGAGQGPAANDVTALQNMLVLGDTPEAPTPGMGFIPCGTSLRAPAGTTYAPRNGAMLWVEGGNVSYAVNGGPPPGNRFNTTYQGNTSRTWSTGNWGYGQNVVYTTYVPPTPEVPNPNSNPNNAAQQNIYVQRQITGDTGPDGTNGTVEVVTMAGTNANNSTINSSETNIISRMMCYSPKPGQKVSGQFIAERYTASGAGNPGPEMWALVPHVADLTGRKSSISQGGLLISEGDMKCSGPDDALARYGYEAICLEASPSVDGPTSATAAFRVRPAGDAGNSNSTGPCEWTMGMHVTSGWGGWGTIRHGFVADSCAPGDGTGVAFNAGTSTVTLALAAAASVATGGTDQTVRVGSGTLYIGSVASGYAFTTAATVNRISIGQVVTGHASIPAGTKVKSISGVVVTLTQTLTGGIPNGTVLTFASTTDTAFKASGTYNQQILDLSSQYGQEAQLLNGLTVGSPTGNKKGKGSINAESAYINGAPVPTASAANQSYTPVVTFATPGDWAPSYTTQTGTYYQIGRLVYFYANIVFTTQASTTASGALRVSLPAVASSGVLGGLPVSALWGTTAITWPGSGTMLNAQVVNGLAYATVLSSKSASTTSPSTFAPSTLGNGNAVTITVSGVYLGAAS